MTQNNVNKGVVCRRHGGTKARRHEGVEPGVVVTCFCIALYACDVPGVTPVIDVEQRKQRSYARKRRSDVATKGQPPGPPDARASGQPTPSPPKRATLAPGSWGSSGSHRLVRSVGRWCPFQRAGEARCLTPRLPGSVCSASVRSSARRGPHPAHVHLPVASRSKSN